MEADEFGDALCDSLTVLLEISQEMEQKKLDFQLNFTELAWFKKSQVSHNVSRLLIFVRRSLLLLKIKFALAVHSDR